MGKSKKAVSRMVDCFAEEIEQRFAGLSFAPVLDPEDGNDAWLYVYVPSNSPLSEDEVLEFARQIEDRIWRESSVSLVPMIRKQKEPAHG